MKILGVLLTWNNIEFLKCSLKQALEFCDEVILVEGCHYKKYPKRSTDGTYEFIQSLDHPKLVIRDFNFQGRNDIVQWKIRETFSKQSDLWEPGNWVAQWDDDIAFFDDDLKKIKEVMKKTKRDMVRFKERRFNYNFKINVFNNNVGAYHFDRITEDCFYRPTWKMFYKNGKRYKKYEFLKDVVYFHYPYVKPPDRVKFRWEISVEKGNMESAKRYEQFMRVKWDQDEDIFKYKEIIESINAMSGLNVYYGKHPEIMENHKWRYKKDCREL